MNTIFGKGTLIVNSEESNTEGLLGLELLRHDLQQAGFGLFSDDTSIPSYREAANAPYTKYNDANAIPRAIVTDNDLPIAGILGGTADYFSIKATTVARTTTSQLWSYLNETGVPKKWNRDDFASSNDKMIILEQTLNKTNNLVVRRLIQISPDNYGVAYSSTGAFRDQNNADTDGFYTPSTGKVYYLFGVDNNKSAAFTLRAPFNRADYFISRNTSIPASCSPSTGVLYKATMNQSDGKFEKIPILDCVAGMQVVLGWNTSATPENSSDVQAYSSADGVTVSGNHNGLNLQQILNNPMEVRSRLRLVIVYILAQDGRVDNNFVNAGIDAKNMLIGDTNIGASLTKSVDLTSSNFIHYRWKLHRVAVRLKNLF